MPQLSIDRGSQYYRGAQVREINGDIATVRLHREINFIVDRECDVDLLWPGIEAGQPICVEVSDVNDACDIVAAHQTAAADRALEERWRQETDLPLASRTFAPGRVPASLGGNE